MAMVPLARNNSIRRFRSMKGRSRLEVKDDLTDSLLSLDLPEPEFIESVHKKTDYGEWAEYYILLRFRKIETPEYFKYLMYQFGIILDLLKEHKIQDFGIQEVETCDTEYYLLLYIIRRYGEEDYENKEDKEGDYY